MTIAAKLLQINGVKEDIRDAIESFGYDLSNAEFTEYAQYICAIGTPTTIQITADGTNTGTISDDLTELTHVKTDIKNAIESKGISLTNVPFTEYAQYIYQIPVVTSSPVRFTATQNGSIGWCDATYPSIEFNKNGDGWEVFNSTVDVNSGDYVEFRNNGTAWVTTSATRHFTTTGSFNLSGELLTLKNRNSEASLAPSDFYALFKDCGIVDASGLLLPSTTAPQCYASMFEGCTQLTTAPVLPALNPTIQSYSRMFYGCSSLNYLDARFTAKPTYQPSNMMFFQDWLYGVAATGTFVKNPDATWVNTTVEHPVGYEITVIPSSWTIYCPLTLTAEEDGCTVQLTKSNTNAPNVSLSYSTDGVNWSAYTVGNTITLTNVGDFVQFKGTNNSFSSTSSASAYNRFVLTGTISAGGDATSLLNNSGGDYQMNETSVSVNKYCFNSLFRNCTSLTKAPNLPSTKLASFSYYYMFYGCTNLVIPPSELPYANCRNNASSGSNIYTYQDVYSYMFYGCTQLTMTPLIKGIANSRNSSARVVGNTAAQMFSGCTSLTDIYASGTWVLYTIPLSSSTKTYSCLNWMQNVPTNVGTIHLPSTSGYTGFDGFLNDRGISSAPVGWSVSYDIS